MPKVKMLTSMAAADWSLSPGDEVEVNEEVAEAWIENGIAKEPEETKPPKDLSYLTLEQDIEVNLLVELLNQNANEIATSLDGLSKEDLETLINIETEGKNRKTVLENINKTLQVASLVPDGDETDKEEADLEKSNG